MLNPLIRLRCCRFLALLAALVLAGVLPHGHGARAASGDLQAGIVLAVADLAAADHGHPAEPGAAGQAHCGLCHATRAVMPLRPGAAMPRALPGTVPALALAASPEGQPGRVPARPPRQPTPA